MERASSPLMPSQITTPAVVQPPKGRGRPRATYAQAGEFDLDLIREYHSRPALYDRSNKLFKDKEHTTELWQEIAHKTGFDVSILRDRIITLRNRYNIEKRRVENKIIESSQWPLYEYLTFLSDHIRTRRSYKRRSKSVDKHDPDYMDEEEHGDVHYDMNSESNGTIKAIKHEIMDNDEISEYDYDDDRQLPVTTVLSIPQSSTPLNGHRGNMNGTRCRQPELFVAGIKQKRAAATALDTEPQEKRNNNYSQALSNAAPAASGAAGPTTTYPKFRAFGEFVSHSLNELPHSVSMRLIEKFTHDLVQATIKSTAASEQHNRDSAGDASSLDDVDD